VNDVPVKAELKADLTEPLSRLSGVLEKLVVGGLDFAAVAFGPAGAALNHVKALIERQTARLGDFAEKVERLQHEQLTSGPKEIPDKCQRETLQAVSVEDDEDVRLLWAQLTVNIQAGLSVNDYLLHVLRQLNGDDVRYLKTAVEYGRKWPSHYSFKTPSERECVLPKSVDKLLSLRLLKETLEANVDQDIPLRPSYRMEESLTVKVSGGVSVGGFETTDLAYALYDAAMAPTRLNLGER
jgi:hypothetical protein